MYYVQNAGKHDSRIAEGYHSAGYSDLLCRLMSSYDVHLLFDLPQMRQVSNIEAGYLGEFPIAITDLCEYYVKSPNIRSGIREQTTEYDACSLNRAEGS